MPWPGCSPQCPWWRSPFQWWTSRTGRWIHEPCPCPGRAAFRPAPAGLCCCAAWRTPHCCRPARTGRSCRRWSPPRPPARRGSGTVRAPAQARSTACFDASSYASSFSMFRWGHPREGRACKRGLSPECTENRRVSLQPFKPIAWKNYSLSSPVLSTVSFRESPSFVHDRHCPDLWLSAPALHRLPGGTSLEKRL